MNWTGKLDKPEMRADEPPPLSQRDDNSIESPAFSHTQFNPTVAASSGCEFVDGAPQL